MYDTRKLLLVTLTLALTFTFVPAASGQSLVGAWDWMGQPYYVLEANGQGTMAGMAIGWSASNGILSVCVTPEECLTSCPAPQDWYYELAGNQLNLTSTTIPGFAFSYTRR